MRVIELFSGIGGMHYALEDSGVDCEVVLAADINSLANSVYHHNFPLVKIHQTNIQSLTAEFINKLQANMILMSPPCQPFTRVGLKKDALDARTCPLLHLIGILPDLSHCLRFILLENVQGFESSQTRSLLIDSLESVGFAYSEFLISPQQCHIPNSRTRYYLVATRGSATITDTPRQLTKDLSSEFKETTCKNENHRKPNQQIQDFLRVTDENAVEYNDYLIPDKVLEKRINVFDVVTKSDRRSLCFTKAYSHYAEGTGSIYCPYDRATIDRLYEKSKQFVDSPAERLNILKELRLRYFTPQEVANLMCFPTTFSLPQGVTNRQGYRLLGNSINVHVVATLINIMCKVPDRQKRTCDTT